MAAPRKKKLLRNPTFTIPMISVAILSGVFLVYYLLNTSHQEASVNNKAFRSLAAISDQVQSKVVNYAPVLEQAAKKGSDIEVKKYLATYVPDLRVVSEPGNPCSPGSVAVSTRLDKGHYYLEFCKSGNWRADVAVEEVIAPSLQDSTAAMFDEILLTDNKGVVLYQTLKTGSRISDIGSLVEPVLQDKQEKKDGKSAASPPEPNATFSRASESSNLLSVSMAGTDYKLYLVPVPLKLSSNAANQQPQSEGARGPLTLTVCGLMQTSRFRTKSLAVPETALVILVLLLPVVIVGAWPLLKLSFMQATERIPRAAGLYFVSSTLVTIILICMLAIHVVRSNDTQEIDGNLASLAGAIERNIEQELRQALHVMDSVGRSTAFGKIKTQIDDNLAKSKGKPCKDEDQNLNEQNEVQHAERNVLSTRGLQLNYYPYFYSITWTDNRGNQRIKWEVAEQSTPPTPVGDRFYFQATMNNRLWYFSSSDRAESRFRVDPVFSRYTGEYVAVISKHAAPLQLCSDTFLSLVSMGTPLLSLTNPVLPPDYGFAMIDRDGKVLFHSTPAKNDRENFFNELEESKDLQAAVFARQSNHLDVQYIGLDHRVFVTPLTKLQQCPWSLVVFYDFSTDESRRLGEMTLFGGLVLIYCGIILTCLLLAYLRSAHAHSYPPRWIWPSEAAKGSYVHLALFLILLILAFYLLIFEATLREILAAAFAIPFSAAAVFVLKLRSKDRAIRWIALTLLTFSVFQVFVVLRKAGDARAQRLPILLFCMGLALLALSVTSITQRLGQLKRPSFQNSFTAVGVLMFMLAGILPSIAFFKIAYDYHVDLWTRREQIQALAALADREERVKQRNSKLQLSSSSNGADGIDVDKDLVKWLFLRRRLEESLDRYDLEFLKRLGQIYSRQPAAGSGARTEPDELPAELTLLVSLIPYRGDNLTRQLSQAALKNSVWSWTREGTNRLRLQQTAAAKGDESIDRSPPAKALSKAVSNDPLFLSQDVVSILAVLGSLPWHWAVIVFFSSGLVMFLWIRPAIGRLFLLGTRSSEPFPAMSLVQDTPIKENLILLASGHPAETEILRTRKDTFLVDVPAVILGAEIDYKSITETQSVVALDHFHFRNEDPAANLTKLEILEALNRMSEQKRVVIITAIDPIVFVEGEADVLSKTSTNAPDRVEEVERWAQALLGFKRGRLVSGTPAQSGESYRILWSTCSLAQRAALYQLAHDGWANYKNEAALNQLQMQGLVSGRPIRIVEDGFRGFILEAVSSEDRKDWERHDNVSIWKAVRITFLVMALAFIAVALFYSQQATLGYIVTLLSVLTPAIKLFTEARGPSAGPKVESEKA